MIQPARGIQAISAKKVKSCLIEMLTLCTLVFKPLLLKLLHRYGIGYD
jgi:hypothetical protein